MAKRINHEYNMSSISIPFIILEKINSIFEEPDGGMVCMGTLRTDASAEKGWEDIFFLRCIGN